MAFYVTKCKIGNPAANCNHKYTLHGVVLELLEDIRDLGICMDSKLKFHTHPDLIANKENRILGLISKVFECKDSDIILKLYKSLVCPLLDRPEPIMLKILPIILSRISQKTLLLFFLLFLYPAYYSIIILIQYISMASRLVFKMLL